MNTSADREVIDVIFLLSSLAVGGSEKKTIKLVNCLVSKGYRVGICYLSERNELDDLIIPEVPCFAIKRNFSLSLKTILQLRSLVNRYEVKRIISVNLYPLLYASLCAFLKRGKIDVVALVNTSTHRNLKEAFYSYIYAFLLRRVSLVVFGSDNQKRHWVKKYSLDDRKIVRVYNSVDTNYFSCADHQRSIHAGERAKKSLVIGTVCVLREEKCVDLLIHAAARLHQMGIDNKLIIVGDGPMRSRLKELSINKKIDRFVSFPGKVNDVRPFLQEMDVFVLCSKSVETFSNATLEAMACGKCVVVSKVGGASEMLIDGESGFLFRPNDLSGLVSTLACLSENRDILLDVGQNARKRVESCFGGSQMMAFYRRAIDDVAPRRDRRWLE